MKFMEFEMAWESEGDGKYPLIAVGTFDIDEVLYFTIPLKAIVTKDQGIISGTQAMFKNGSAVTVCISYNEFKQLMADRQEALALGAK